MSFDFSTLITDRTQADVNRVKQIAEKIKNGTASESELAEFNSAAMKGAYNHTDLNRVTVAMEALKSKLEGYGYAVPGYQRIKVPHPVTGGGSRLPEGYTELAWIESSGTQYVDTGFKPDQNTRVVMDAQSVVAGAIYWGCRASSSSTDSKAFVVLGLSAGGVRSDYFGSTKSLTGVVATSRITLDQNKNAFTAGGSSATHTATTNASSLDLYLCAINQAGSATTISGKGIRIYSCQVYDNGTLIRDYVPCINPDGVVGLFDVVNKKFYGNAGTGVFVAGPVPGSYNPVFSDNSWSEIIEACEKNKVPETWKPGDQKTMTIEGAEYWVDIIGKNHDLFSDGSGVAPLTFQLHECYSSAKRMNGSATSSGSWEKSEMRNTTLPLLLTLMPSEVQSAIKAVDKRTAAGSTGTNSKLITVTSDKLFLLSEVEVFGSTYYSPSIDEGTQYEYYAAGNSKIKYTGSTAQLWWERSPLTAEGFFCAVSTTGDFEGYQAHTSRYVAFAFCFACNHVEEQEETKEIVVDSTEAEYDLYTWYEFDWPTPETMTVYLLNVSAIRSVFAVMASTPVVPADMANLMAQEANDIEKILEDINFLLTSSAQSWYYSGDVFSGEV